MPTSFTDLMRDADPAATLRPVSPEDRAAALDAAMAAEPARNHRPRVRWLAVAAAAALVAGGAVVLQLTGPTAAEARADEVLRTAAINATDPPTRPGQYWEIRTELTTKLGVCAGESDPGCADGYLGRQVQVSYVEVTGALPSWQVFEPEEVLAPLGGTTPTPRLTERAANTSNLSPNDLGGSWQQPTGAWLADLPREVDALRQRLYADSAGHGSGPDDSAFTYAADALRSGLVPADLRTALFDVLASIPGVSVTDERAEVNGVTGVAIAHRTARATSVELIVDPQAGQVVAEREAAVDRSLAEYDLGSVITRQLVEAVPADVQAIAQHQECQIADDGLVTCDH